MRKVWDIHGGIHPQQNKEQSLQTSIKEASIPAELVYPLSQHIGAPASPIVNLGDKVLKGQMIAQAKGFVSVPLHASTSGEIIAIEDRPIPHASGMSGPCIVLKSDGLDQWADHKGIEDYRQLDKAELTNYIRNAGIAGMGGAGFPSAIKLNTRPDVNIETLIINGTECEPYITADDILMRERAENIVAGIQILQHILKPSVSTLIGVEDNKPEAIAALNKAVKNTNIDVVVFPTKYPSGGEKQLIQILTGKEVISGKLPADIGIVVQNIGTTEAIYNAVVKGEPLISRVTTVTGNAVAKQQNYQVRLGTPMSHLLTLSGFDDEMASRLIMGGPMMGFAMHSTAIPIVKTSNCILVPTKAEMPDPDPQMACIRCGMCAEACPVSLLPQQLYWYSKSKEYDKLESHNLFDCIECGACSFSCPSNIPLVQYYRASKSGIRHKAEELKKSEHAKQRFEARQERLEQQEREKEEKRKARLEAAKNKSSAQDQASNTDNDPVKAAVERAKAKAAGSATDPVQAAIDRAKAKAAGETVAEASPLEKAQKQVATFEKRLATNKEKLSSAKAEGSDKVDAFQTAVDKAEEKLALAKSELAKLETETAPQSAAASDEADPAQAAIERAMAKRSGQAQDEDPKSKLEKEIASLEKRISNAESKLADADETKADALKSSIEKQKEKLAEAKKNLAALTPAAVDAPVEAKVESDPAADAIARAMAKRAGAADIDPKTKLENELVSLNKRISNTEQKLNLAKEEGSDKVDALESSLEKMRDKLNKAQAELDELINA
jgi:electron transport complex protein RnfC